MELDDWFAIGMLTIIVIVWFVLFIIFMVRRKKSSVPVSIQSQSPIPVSVPVPVQSPVSSSANPYFRSARVIDGNGSNFYYMSDGYLTFRRNKDMSEWGVDKPLNYTHAKINRLIFKFDKPNSSDSSGFIVDEFGNKLENQPASEFSNIIEFGFFI